MGEVEASLGGASVVERLRLEWATALVGELRNARNEIYSLVT